MIIIRIPISFFTKIRKGHTAKVSNDFLKTTAHLQFHLDQATQPIKPNKVAVKVIGASTIIAKISDPRMMQSSYFEVYLLPALIFDYDISDGGGVTTTTASVGVARKFTHELFIAAMLFLTFKH